MASSSGRRAEHKTENPRRRRWCGSGGGPGLNPVPAPCYFWASSAETSFSETELMQKRWSVGVP